MHFGRVFSHAGSYEGRIYITGGFTGNGIAIAESEFYDPAADSWVMDSLQFPYLPEPRWGAGAACAGDVFFLYGGVDRGFNYFRNAAEYDITTRTWTTVSIPNDLYRGGAWGNRLGQGFVAGIYYKQFPVAGVTTLPTSSRAESVLPTVYTHGMLYWPGVPGLRGSNGTQLVDLSGRGVADLLPGMNDLSHLAPGVYFAPTTPRVTKVVRLR